MDKTKMYSTAPNQMKASIMSTSTLSNKVRYSKMLKLNSKFQIKARAQLETD